MNNLDVYTEHWLDEGGQQDEASQAWADLHDDDVADSQRLHGPTRLDEASADMDCDTRQAYEEARGRAADADDWEEAKPHREWLSERYPDTPLDTYARGMLDWANRFKADPIAARDGWIRSWAAMPPVQPRPRSAAAKAAVPSDTPDRYRFDVEREIDVRNAYAAAVADKADRDGYGTSADVRQAIKQQTGLSLSQFLDSCRQIDEASRTDAVAIADRFARFNGVPATTQQAAELQHQANAGARVAQAQGLVDQVAASGALPGLGTPAVDAATAAILEDRNFPRSGDAILDLRNAHHCALQQLAAGHTPTASDNARLQTANEAVQWAAATLPNYNQLEPVIADILNNSGFKRTGDMHVDLSMAHAAAERIAAGGYQSPPAKDHAAALKDLQGALAEFRDVHGISAAKAKRASRSVSGSPNPGASAQRKDDSNDVWADARAAYRSASASI